MPHSGFKTAKKIINLSKKENNNKDYRTKEKIHPKCSFSRNIISFNYILRTKYGICLNEANISYLNNYYMSSHTQIKLPYLITFDEHTHEENKIIQQEINLYYNSKKTQKMCSRDKTHSDHSKTLTKNRNNARKKNCYYE
jgi:hypothetical protein